MEMERLRSPCEATSHVSRSNRRLTQTAMGSVAHKQTHAPELPGRGQSGPLWLPGQPGPLRRRQFVPVSPQNPGMVFWIKKEKEKMGANAPGI